MPNHHVLSVVSLRVLANHNPEVKMHLSKGQKTTWLAHAQMQESYPHLKIGSSDPSSQSRCASRAAAKQGKSRVPPRPFGRKITSVSRKRSKDRGITSERKWGKNYACTGRGAGSPASASIRSFPHHSTFSKNRQGRASR
jgi:hypothetical protein